MNEASQCPPGGLLATVGQLSVPLSVMSAASSGHDLVLPIADAFGFQPLSGGLKDADPEVRLATAESLAEMAQLIVRAINVAVGRLGAQDSGDRQTACMDLETTGRQAVRGVVEALVDALHDKSPEMRRSVATTLGSLGQALARARSALGVALRDRQKDVRVSAAQALSAMGSVVTTISTALRVARDQEEDDKTAEAIREAERNVEGKLAGPGTAKK